MKVEGGLGGPLRGLPLGRGCAGGAGARTGRRLIAFSSALGLVLVALFPAPAAGQLYRWTDAEGVERYTNDLATIPPAYRDAGREIGSPQPRPAEPQSALAPTVVPFAAGQPIRTAVRLNGVSLTLVLDTGADRTVISPAAAARAGFDSQRSREVHIVGATGTAAAREVVVERLDLAGTRAWTHRCNTREEP